MHNLIVIITFFFSKLKFCRVIFDNPFADSQHFWDEFIPKIKDKNWIQKLIVISQKDPITDHYKKCARNTFEFEWNN